MQRTKSLAMGVVGPRHQLGTTTGVVAAFPQHSKGQAHTLLIPVAQQDTHPPGWGSAPSPQLLRAAEPGGAAVPALPRLLCPGGRGTQGQKNHVCQGGEGTQCGLSSRECTLLSQGCSRGSSGLQPVLYLLQTKSVCTENSPAGVVLRFQTNTIL